MEPKTIGKFITTLRKANGMTQKELAEKLNVSDKTVSRWERDDGAPDLSVIPVIAEIFGVTCDELLRGERKSPAERTAEPVEEPTAKGEKQRKRILSMGLSNYRNQTYLTMGISAVGLIAAMICNLGFLRAYIGFLVSTIFYVGSVVLQAICTNGAFQSVSDDAIPEEEAAAFKTAVIYLAKRAICFTTVLLGVTIPLIVYPNDTYVGLEASSWLLTGLFFGIISFVVCQVGWYFLHARLVRNGLVSMDEKQLKCFWHNQKLERSCAIILAALVLVTGLVQSSFNEMNPAWRLAHGTEFSDYESFVEFMEQDIDPDYHGSNVVPVPDDTVYYDQFGNEIPEEEVLRSEVRIHDGTEEGKVVCTYIHRNGSVQDIKTSDTEDGLPIMAITYSDYRAAQQKVSMINGCFVVLYVLECLVVVLIYRKTRMK